MSTFNSETTNNDQGGRNLVVLISGGVVLVGALFVLIFSGSLFGTSDLNMPPPPAVAQSNGVTLPVGGPPLQVGDQPYEFALQGINGETLTLSQFIGRPILVNFWATWCGPCRIEMPEIQAVYEQYKDDGFVVLALDQDETGPEVQAYFDELGLTFTPVLDTGSDTAKNFGLQGTLPASVFINPDGEVTAIHRGVMTRGQLETFLAETIPGKSAS